MIITRVDDITNITMETSTVCNAKCVICPNNKNRRKSYFTPLENIKETISLFPNLKEISLCGMYEPLIDERLNIIFKTIKSLLKKINGFKIIIFMISESSQSVIKLTILHGILHIYL